MGRSKADKAESHDRIVRIAAARFREKGVEGVGLADLMAEAGLTHGGFYRHFPSRDALVAEAVACALADGGKAVEAIAARQEDRAVVIAALIDAYLSTIHRDAVAASCAVVTLASDVARAGERTREAYTRQVQLYLEVLGKLIAGDEPGPRRVRAVGALSTLVGAVAMARAVNDTALSDEILKAAAAELKAALA